MNVQRFSKQDIEKGLYLKLIDLLVQANTSNYQNYNEIHITQPNEKTIEIQWVQKDFSQKNDSFKYIKENEAVVHKVILPNGDEVWCENEEEEKKCIARWNMLMGEN